MEKCFIVLSSLKTCECLRSAVGKEIQYISVHQMICCFTFLIKILFLCFVFGLQIGNYLSSAKAGAPVFLFVANKQKQMNV